MFETIESYCNSRTYIFLKKYDVYYFVLCSARNVLFCTLFRRLLGQARSLAGQPDRERESSQFFTPRSGREFFFSEFSKCAKLAINTARMIISSRSITPDDESTRKRWYTARARPTPLRPPDPR